MKKNFWKENGILIGLYGVVGALAVTAGTLTYNGYKEAKTDGFKDNETVQVESTLTESFKNQKEQEDEKLESLKKLSEKLRQKNNEEDKKTDVDEGRVNTLEEKKESIELEEAKTNFETEEKENSTQTSKIEEVEEIEAIEELEEEDLKEEVENTFNIFNKKRKEQLKPIKKEEKEKIEDIEKENIDKRKEAKYDLFTKEDKLNWPVNGKVLMAFNVEKLIYDQTLHQYRTNSDIAIQAKKGTKVYPAASGEVVETGNTELNGGYVVIDHGNGYKTKYSQLINKHVVKKGDIVLEGEVIGHVGSPTTQSVLLGDHMTLEVKVNDVAYNPVEYLK